MLLGKLDAEIEILNYFIMYVKLYIWICGVTLIKAEKKSVSIAAPLVLVRFFF